MEMKGKKCERISLFFLHFFFLWPCDHYPFPFPGTIKKKNTQGLRFSADDSSLFALLVNEMKLFVFQILSRCFSGSIYSLGCSVIPWTLLWYTLKLFKCSPAVDYCVASTFSRTHNSNPRSHQRSLVKCGVDTDRHRHRHCFLTTHPAYNPPCVSNVYSALVFLVNYSYTLITTRALSRINQNPRHSTVQQCILTWPDREYIDIRPDR